MAFRTLAAAFAVAAAPLAMLDAQAPPAGKDGERKVCEVTGTIGTRLGNVRRCRTKAEREEAQREARRVVDRIQADRPTMCPPPPRPC
jgi:hypothetical protein